MPELPDVEGFRRALADELPGRRIQAVDVRDAGVLRNTTARALTRNLVKHTFGEPARHGKWLILPTDGPVLLVHSGMTGQPYFAVDGADEKGYERLVISLDRGELRYADLRKLRGIWLAPDRDATDEVMGKQGPDALGLDLVSFRNALEGRRGALKPTLMDQSVIAGLGNLLVDEICWRVKVYPGCAVSAVEAPRLHKAMKSVLRTAVPHGRVPGLPRWLTRVRDHPDPACPRCHTRLRRNRIAGRTTVWCPNCQHP
ncbi:formamidopyrimidine-DNA glycosylase [Mycobacterium sp. ACS1612]|uniref:Fpg/Nei family DNA glycosylase n=1 Tax=Mycobacterium sp. ACS1612 TaxID=1834117 RepID=UPI0007FE82DA|nr:DNA-formamidopyrimidine glycosylase family protein [Mycobacterium sp. ACS1612]OBF27165.1 formamidopyrimidine-DNA glycosylase [Mycobacterium sp. ACS1612]